MLDNVANGVFIKILRRVLLRFIANTLLVKSWKTDILILWKSEANRDCMVGGNVRAAVVCRDEAKAPTMQWNDSAYLMALSPIFCNFVCVYPQFRTGIFFILAP